MKKIIHSETLYVILKYFLVTSTRKIIFNFILPIIPCIFIYIFNRGKELDVIEYTLTVNSIIIGFCTSIIIMLITIDNENIRTIKTIKIPDTNVNLLQSLLYKFGFIIFNSTFCLFLSMIICTLSIDFLIIEVFIIYLILLQICGCGGIGRRTSLRS